MCQNISQQRTRETQRKTLGKGKEEKGVRADGEKEREGFSAEGALKDREEGE